MAKSGYKKVPPRALIKRYSEVNYGPAATRDLLAFHLREGNIQARAPRVWVSTEKNSQAAWRREPSPDTSESKNDKTSRVIKCGSWRRSRDWLSDVISWDLKKNRFFITLQQDPPKRLMFRGIYFHGGDVKK